MLRSTQRLDKMSAMLRGDSSYHTGFGRLRGLGFLCGIAAILATNLEAQSIDSQLMQACAQGELTRVRQLIGGSAKLYLNTLEPKLVISPLMIAALRGRFEVVAELLSAGADVNLKDNLGFRALDYAALGAATDASIPAKNVKVIQLLKAKGALPARNDPKDLSEAINVFTWTGSRPTSPHCYEQIGEKGPCGRPVEKPKQ
jgi:hypothetical protein